MKRLLVLASILAFANATYADEAAPTCPAAPKDSTEQAYQEFKDCKDKEVAFYQKQIKGETVPVQSETPQPVSQPQPVAPVANVPRPPSWEEFCPPEYLNAQVSSSSGVNKGALFAMALNPMIGLAMMGSSNRKVTQNYWAQRHQQFDSEVALCGQSSGDKAMCYMQVQQMESQKNEGHYNRVAEQNAARASQPVYNAPAQPASVNCTTMGAPGYYTTNCR